jgi:hypothetical protein
MRLIYKDKHEGKWFSHNGHLAYLAGERPDCLLPPGHGWEPTTMHHIARLKGKDDYSRELVMFYRNPNEA